MNIESIKNNLTAQGIFHSETNKDNPSVIGYEKKFKWSWMATQLNTFIVATDFGSKEITVEGLEKHMEEAFRYAQKNYNGWPRGFQSGLGVISILISDNISAEAKAYCKGLKSGKKWAGFTIPVAYDSKLDELYMFEKNPMWGRIYFPHFKSLINGLVEVEEAV